MNDAKRQLRFINIAHFIDHYVLLIFPTVVIGLQLELARSYAELIALSTACFVAFGLFSLPWGWLADYWSRRKIMAIFFFGCAVAMAGIAFAPNVFWIGAGLLLLGVFAAIYHPVGVPMVLSNATDRGRDIATNGVFGNLGVAFAPGITAGLIVLFGWRSAFLIPAVVCALLGVAYLYMTSESREKIAERARVAEVPLTWTLAAAMFGFFALIAFAGGIVFNTITIAIPQIVKEGFAEAIPLTVIGSIATGVLLFGGVTQLIVGRLVSRYAPHILFAVIGAMQATGVIWAYFASGPALLGALTLSIIAIYGQVTLSDIVISRYTADAWRGRIYAVRFFLAFITSGIAVAMIAALHGQGGFTLVLLTTAIFAALFAVSTFAVAVIATRVEARAHAAQPAE
ncbi:MAG: MFS transporter [Xanthobacteraceae bacterium]|nr:MFS transporter [Xanthobacteraceae bacterium]QYK44009.1 MAG: MFS transporter [Xanthobacteraceae bacterium]HMN50583.1 MFS transporter [Xanthobacteraceae bacterium]